MEWAVEVEHAGVDQLAAPHRRRAACRATRPRTPYRRPRHVGAGDRRGPKPWRRCRHRPRWRAPGRVPRRAPAGAAGCGAAPPWDAIADRRAGPTPEPCRLHRPDRRAGNVASRPPAAAVEETAAVHGVKRLHRAVAILVRTTDAGASYRFDQFHTFTIVSTRMRVAASFAPIPMVDARTRQMVCSPSLPSVRPSPDSPIRPISRAAGNPASCLPVHSHRSIHACILERRPAGRAIR